MDILHMDNNNPWKIMIVDDDHDIHSVTKFILKRLKFQGRGLEFIHAYSAKEAKEKLKEHQDIAIALLDVVMEDEAAGLNLVKCIRDEFHNDGIRLIIRTGNPGMAPEESVTMDYDINDYRGKTELTAQSLKTVVITALRSYNSLTTIQNLNNEIDKTQQTVIYSLSEIAESRGTDIGNHVKRVGLISQFLAQKMGYDSDRLKHVNLAASMHDIGKMAINDNVLNKPGKLTADEFELMKKHCEYGYGILKDSEWPMLQMAAQIAYEHHENFDGSGYPNGLEEDKIGLLSRIVALVDVFDALATKRVYKDAWEFEKIFEFIKQQNGIKFDPAITECFFENIDSIFNIIHEVEQEIKTEG